MAFNVIYKSSVKEDLKNIPKKQTLKIINKIEKLLRENPLVYPQLKGEYRGLRKFRAGDYRVIYIIDKNDVIILKIGNRKNVYE